MPVYFVFCFLSAAAFYWRLSTASGQVAIDHRDHSRFHRAVPRLVILGQSSWFPFKQVAADTMVHIDFEHFLLEGILGFLLFAGGLGVKIDHLRDQKWEIAVLAIGATLMSTLVIGFGLYAIGDLAGIHLDLIYCMLFGALISPTDPIAVLAIVKNLNAPPRMSTQIEGESLFNDGLGLVVFLALYGVAFGGETPTASSVATLFAQEAIGGIAYGLVLGLIFHGLISSTDDHSLELLLTIVVPTAGYALAHFLHVSGPLAMVVAGIMIGNWTRRAGFSKESEQHLDHFWELVDEFLNGLLFLLIGLTLLLIDFHTEYWVLMAASIPLVLLARFCGVGCSFLGFRRFRQYNAHSVKILTWGGLRGGLAMAMALSIPPGYWVIEAKQIDVRELILVMTYATVVFSILVQGSTITPLIQRSKRDDAVSDSAVRRREISPDPMIRRLPRIIGKVITSSKNTTDRINANTKRL